MKKKNVEAIDVRGKRVLVRLDLNVPLDARQQITNDRRIRAALPTVKRLIEGGGRLTLMSHLGRPKGEPGDRSKFSLKPVAVRMGELLGKPVALVEEAEPDAIDRLESRSHRWAVATGRLGDGDVCLLENLRFHAGETIKDKEAAKDSALRQKKDDFARGLARLADVYVNDAFGTFHRDNASMLTVPQMMEGKPRVIGYLVERELKFLGTALADPARPFVCVLGGAKVSDKIAVIRSLMTRCDTILIGGAMAYTFFAAEGLDVGRSLVEPDRFEVARDLRADAANRLKLPVDSVVACELAEGVATEVCEGSIPADMMGLDIGPRAIAEFKNVIAAAKTIVWNGPMGVFETPPFDRGTMAIAEALADATTRGATTIVGGGDSAAALEKAGLADRMTHVSTGGGASLEFLEGKPFQAIEVLDNA